MDQDNYITFLPSNLLSFDVCFCFSAGLKMEYFLLVFQLHQIKLSVCIAALPAWIVAIVAHLVERTSFAYPSWLSILWAIVLYMPSLRMVLTE